MKRVAWAICLSFCLLACTSEPAKRSGSQAVMPALPPSDPRRDEILQEVRNYYSDFNARNWTAFAEHFWPGATLTTTWQPPPETPPRVVVTSLPEFLAQTAQGPDSKPIFSGRMLDAEVHAFQDLAQAWARYQARFGEAGKVEEWTGLDAFTLMRHQGRWKIVSIAFARD